MMISNRTRLALLAITLTASAAALAGCPASFPDICNDDPNCGVDGSAPDGTTGDGAPACDPSKDLSCVTDASGIFINGTSGSDSAAGTKEAPLKTITAALSKATGSKSNLYICAGTYGEHVKLTSAMNLVGGFACADWTYAPANKPKIAPSDVGYALEIESVAGPTSISDLEFDAQPGTTASTSSIAAFVNASPKITLTRVSLSAGAGVQGADGSSSATTTLARGQKGNNASAANGGLALSCPCPDGATVGGGGGNFILGQSNGDAGTPNLSGTSPKDGAGGTGELASCSASGGAGLGHDGADGDAGAAAASAITAGVVDTAGFHPSNGKDGTAGVRGQGGGGGGATTAGTSGAGGGGCGGCGG
ncbi:MAG TPA: DUF1565 domain-containing protein, partial [Polyangiaceae bacterium]